MKKVAMIAAAACAAVLVSGTAHAQVVLNSVRIGAVDSDKLAKFYEEAFGMAETNRLKLPAGPEIFLNFGANAEEAKANKALRLAIMHRDSDDIKDQVPHMIFNVTDMAATEAAIKAHGGSFDGEPKPFGNGGPMIGIAVDPVGNKIELIQAARRNQ